MNLRPGDIACSHFPSALAWLISEAEKRDAPGLSGYTHSFIIADEVGATIDTTETVHIGDLYRDYADSQVIIARLINANPAKIKTALATIVKDIGKLYPIDRLVLDALDLGRVIREHGKVCSERAVYAISLIGGITDMSDPSGWTPAELAMALRHWREFEVVFEGELER